MNQSPFKLLLDVFRSMELDMRSPDFMFDADQALPFLDACKGTGIVDIDFFPQGRQIPIIHTLAKVWNAFSEFIPAQPLLLNVNQPQPGPSRGRRAQIPLLQLPEVTEVAAYPQFLPRIQDVLAHLDQYESGGDYNNNLRNIGYQTKKLVIDEDSDDDENNEHDNGEDDDDNDDSDDDDDDMSNHDNANNNINHLNNNDNFPNSAINNNTINNHNNTLDSNFNNNHENNERDEGLPTPTHPNTANEEEEKTEDDEPNEDDEDTEDDDDDDKEKKHDDDSHDDDDDENGSNGVNKNNSENHEQDREHDHDNENSHNNDKNHRDSDEGDDKDSKHGHDNGDEVLKQTFDLLREKRKRHREEDESESTDESPLKRVTRPNCFSSHVAPSKPSNENIPKVPKRKADAVEEEIAPKKAKNTASNLDNNHINNNNINNINKIAIAINVNNNNNANNNNNKHHSCNLRPRTVALKRKW